MLSFGKPSLPQVLAEIGISVLPGLRARKFFASSDGSLVVKYLGEDALSAGFRFYTEWKMGPKNLDIPTEDYVRGFLAFLDALV